MSITLPDGRGEGRILSPGAASALPGGTWTVAEISDAGTACWSVRLRLVG
ncbi:hypothetical protein ACFY7H_10615 [Streptomyces sp. NPDC012794]